MYHIPVPQVHSALTPSPSCRNYITIFKTFILGSSFLKLNFMQDFQSAQCTVRFDIILQRQHWIYGWNWILKSLVFRFLDTESLVFRFLDTESLVFWFLDTESLDFRSLDSESLVFHFSLYRYLDFESLIVWFLNSESLVVCSLDSESLDYRSADFESLFIRSLNSECLLGLLLYKLWKFSLSIPDSDRLVFFCPETRRFLARV